MISGDSKGVNNNHVWFGSIKKSGKGCNGCCTLMASHMKCLVKILIGHKYCVRHLNKKIFEICLAGQAEPNFKIMCNYICELECF